MGDINGGDARLLLNAANFRAHTHPELGIQIGQRLIKQQHARFQHQRPCQSDTLLLTAGELVGHAGFHALQSHQLENIGHLFLDGSLVQFPQLQAVCHVVIDIVVGQQGIALEHHGGIPLVGGQGIDGFAAQVDFALVRAFKAGNHPQRGGLAAAGGTQQRDKGAGCDFQISILYCIKVFSGFGVFVYFGNMLQANAFFCFRHFSLPPLFCGWFQRT